jgi:murein DD-endopeptidase MepM/ murein hydrolase activator NlpD
MNSSRASLPPTANQRIFFRVAGIAMLLWPAAVAGVNADPASVRTVKQGEVFVVTIQGAAPAPDESSDADRLVARFVGRDWPTFATAEGAGALLGVDMEAAPGAQEFVVERRTPEGITVVRRGTVLVEKADFKTQSLTLPDSQVDLDADTLRRVESEQQAMLAAMQPVTPRLWEGPFVVPAEGKLQQTFGRRRVINGQPRNPHTGEDISAPQGAPVAAINYGTVRLVADQFFSGKSVVIDHGLGLYSMYFHLSDVAVRSGDRVEKAQVIGAVGATGRASGPHLHWGVRLNGARVDPLSLNTALKTIVTATR